MKNRATKVLHFLVFELKRAFFKEETILLVGDCLYSDKKEFPMKKVLVAILSVACFSLAAETITITKQMAEALGKNKITQLFLETGNSLEGAKVTTNSQSYTIRSKRNKDDYVECVTQSIASQMTGQEVCTTYANGVNVSSQSFDLDYIRDFYVEIIKMHRKLK